MKFLFYKNQLFLIQNHTFLVVFSKLVLVALFQDSKHYFCSKNIMKI